MLKALAVAHRKRVKVVNHLLIQTTHREYAIHHALLRIVIYV
jgi:hypothetical protein